MAEFTFTPLTPASFLDRSAAVFADRIAIVDGERRFTYQDMSDRCRRLAARWRHRAWVTRTGSRRCAPTAT